ncbi:S41 family peptidase [Psychrobacter frigidicola]|uniref:S41 family peptidase n=1 Tax=Psychrobacter frigidicola TaxID=45611 RepID=A0A5C7A2Q3_9GAMM|nr:S41 family peptidase [Psychrobacter frigidicola]TXD97522.1 S41 family peptidase [Psychrobacter frigidicola]
MRLSARTASRQSKLWTAIKLALHKPVLKVGLFGILGALSLYSQAALAASSASNSKAPKSSASNKKNSNKAPVIQAKPANKVTSSKKSVNAKVNKSPTAGLQLINLKSDEVTAENGADDLSDIAAAMDDIDDWTDTSAINAVSDASVKASNNINGIPDINTDIPNEVAQVSLNAISPETLKTFVAVVDLIRREYVNPVNDEELFNSAMSGMLTKLDSHAEFLDAEAYENLRAFTQGDVGDIGIKATYQAAVGYWIIKEVINNSPADKKGITIGDYLHQIGEIKLDEDKQSSDIEQLLTGIAGSQVDVVTSKAGRRRHTTTLQRNNTHSQTIETRLIDGIAIIKLPAFQNNSREQILNSLTRLDAPVSGIVLDVRDNPGGVLTSAVEVASLFMDNTQVVQVQSRQSPLQTLATRGTPVLKSLPVVILQNRYSASAAEVLTSSLQTQKRAIIVGELSYGKGSVQSVIPLNDEHAVKLTVAHYLTTTGKKIDKIGVQPDVTLTGNERSWEQQALDILRPKLLSSGIRFVQKGSDNNLSNE